MSTYSLGKHQNWSSPVSRKNVWYKELYSLNTSILRQTAMASDQHCLFLYPPRCLVTACSQRADTYAWADVTGFHKRHCSFSVCPHWVWIAGTCSFAFSQSNVVCWSQAMNYVSQCSLCGANCSTQAFWVQLLGMWFPTKLSGEYALS